MAIGNDEFEIVASADGAADPVGKLAPGWWSLQILADTWGGSTAAALEEAAEDVEASYVASDDPYNTGSAISVTANSKTYTVRGGKFFRLNVTSYSGSSNLRLIARKA